ncbi:MAG: Ig-like domain-containing protein [Firmicutes bacterium]|nr:Ig-like domain-containing protein [Bacillota bacterium]
MLRPRGPMPRPRRREGAGRAVAVAAALAALAMAAPGARAQALIPVPTLGLAGAGAVPAGPAPTSASLRVDLLLRRTGPLPPPPPLGVRYTPAQAADRVAPSPSQYASLASYLAAAGLTVTRRYADRLLLQVVGPTAALERAFHVTLATYERAGRHVLAPAAPAALPASLAATVVGIVGLASDGWPTPAPLERLPNLAALRTPPAPDAAGPVQDSAQADLAAARFLSTFTVSGPSSVAAGLEAVYRVRLLDAAGHPLAGYAVRPVLSQAETAYAGPTGPGSMVTDSSGQASFWLLTGTPSSFALTVAAAPNPPSPPSSAPPSPPPAPPTPVYATAQPVAVSVHGPAASLSPYTASQVNSAYDVTPLLSAGADGHGVGVGIVIWNRFSLSDVESYFRMNGGPQPQVTVVPIDGTPQPGDGGTEATLDVERVGGTAPGSHIYVYDAATVTGVFDALVYALQTAKVSVLSMSWGIPESDVPDGFFDPFEALFDAAAQEGITCIASSGDTGSRADGVHTGVNVPASSPYVLAVGGTQMAVDPATGAIAAQAAWSPDGSFDLGNLAAPAASGGGYSRYYARPPWQVGPGLPPYWTEPFRGVPDVSLAATYPGYATILDGKSQAYGGTSASAPTWAGFVADIESDLGADLGAQLAPLLYAFAAGAAPGVFTPVTAGDNIGFRAAPGWNPVTGLGTPDVALLDQAMRTAFTPSTLEVVRAQTGSLDYVGQTVTVEAVVLDAFGLALGGVPVTVEAPYGAAASPGNTATDATGVATFQLRASAAGVRTYVFRVPAHNGPDALGQELTFPFAVHWLLPPPGG